MNDNECARLGLKYSLRRLRKALEYSVSLGRKEISRKLGKQGLIIRSASSSITFSSFHARKLLINALFQSYQSVAIISFIRLVFWRSVGWCIIISFGKCDKIFNCGII
jgi:hypothetical protein